MIQYLRHDEIDKVLWDECIANSLNGNVYAWSWYLDKVHPDWDALVETSNNPCSVSNKYEYHTVMPLTRKVKYGIQYLCQPFFAQQLGVFSVETLDKETVKRFLDAIPKRYRLVEIRLNEKNYLPSDFARIQFHRNHLLDLNRTYSEICENYHTNTKRNLSKASHFSLRLVPDTPIDTVIRLFRDNRGASVQHWGDAEYRRLAELTTLALEKDIAFVCGVGDDESSEIVAGALFMYSHHRMTFLFSGCGPKGKQKQAMTFLIDQVIRQYADKPLVFDFEGSDDDNLARFYQGFGSRQIFYPELTYRLWPLNLIK